MSFSIPAKTFLLGEYAALRGGAALVLTTTPCFSVTLSDRPGLEGIHPDSPAGRLWCDAGVVDRGLVWHDPFDHQGGLGASTAQFIGAYQAIALLNGEAPAVDAMLEAYWACAWDGKGTRPSGYDLMAQASSGCVFIHREAQQYTSFDWPFEDVSFVLAHTGNKVATHQHLHDVACPIDVTPLSELVLSAKRAFEQRNPSALIESINAYYDALLAFNLVHDHTQQWINQYKADPRILAAKGCGALGADILLLLTPSEQSQALQLWLSEQGLTIMGTNARLYHPKRNQES